MLEQRSWKNHTNCLTYSCWAFKIKYKNTCFTNAVKMGNLPKARKFKLKADVLSSTCPLVCVVSTTVQVRYEVSSSTLNFLAFVGCCHNSTVSGAVAVGVQEE